VIVYARLCITNPDLVERFRLDAPLNPWDVRTFYGGDDHGYTDYPTLAEQRWPDPDTVGLRTSVGSTDASASLPARVGVVGPTRARS
jgi:hypothetical protein